MDDGQPHQRGQVAAFNPNPFQPKGYFEVLKALGVEDRQHNLYCHWVSQFLRQYRGRRRNDLGRAEIRAFLLFLAKEPGTGEWQVAQARYALEIYNEQFRGIGLDRARNPASTAWRPESRAEPGPRAKVSGKASRGTASSRASRPSAPSGPAGPRRSSRESGAKVSARPQASRHGDAGNKVRRGRGADKDSRRPRDSCDGKRPRKIPRPRGRRGAGQVQWDALEQPVRSALRVELYAYKTERTYWHWIRRFVNTIMTVGPRKWVRGRFTSSSTIWR